MSTLWHGRFEDGPADELLAFTVSLPFDQRLARRRPRRLAGPRARAWSGPGSSTEDEAGAVLGRPRPGRGASWPTGTFAFAPTDEDIHTAVERRVTELAGPAGRQAPHRPQPQRPGRHRPAAVHASASARGGRRPRARRCRRCCSTGPTTAGDAYLPGLHPPAAGPAGAAGPPPARPRLGAGPRRRPAARRAGAAPTCRRSAPARWPGSSLPLDPDGVAADLGFARRVRELARRGLRPRLRGRGAVRPRPARRAPLAASARRSCCGRPRSSASSRSPTPTPPAARCCRRRRTPTSPSWPGARPAGSSATSPACWPR